MSTRRGISNASLLAMLFGALPGCGGERVSGGVALWGEGTPVDDMVIVATPAVIDGQERPSLKATSGADGRFSLAGLKFGIPYDVTCQRDGWTCSTARVHVRENGIDGVPLEISAHPFPDVRYTVIDGMTGHPIPDAVVTLDGKPANAGNIASFSAVAVSARDLPVKVHAPGYLDASWTAKIPSEPPFLVDEKVALWREFDYADARVIGMYPDKEQVTAIPPLPLTDTVGWRCATVTNDECVPTVSYPVTATTPRLTPEQMDAAPFTGRWRLLLVREVEGRQPHGSWRRDWLASRVFEVRPGQFGPSDQWKTDDGYVLPPDGVLQPPGGWIGVGKWGYRPGTGMEVVQAFTKLTELVAGDTVVVSDGVVRVGSAPPGFTAVVLPEPGVWALVDVIGASLLTGDLYVVHGGT